MPNREESQTEETDTINLSTQKLGDLCIKKENIITFKCGILGFEELKEFVIVNVEECRPFEWLVSVENPVITFPIINPVPFFTDYNPIRYIADLASLEIKDIKNVEIFCIVTLGDKPENVTINLKGPLLINMENRMGKQFVLTEDYYSLNHPLIKK